MPAVMKVKPLYEINVDLSPEEMEALGKGQTVSCVLENESCKISLRIKGNTIISISEEDFQKCAERGELCQQ